MQRCIWKVIICCALLQVFTVFLVIFSAVNTRVQAKWELTTTCENAVKHPPPPPANNKRKAFVTLISDEIERGDARSYGNAALVMLYELRKIHGNKYEYVAMVTTGISYDTILLLQKLNFTVEIVKTIAPPHKFAGPRRWALTYTKIWAWGFEEYSKIVYIDADHLILKSMDELFEYDELSAVGNGGPRSTRFIAGLLVLVPNKIQMNNLLDAMEHSECHEKNEVDQSFFNWYYKGRWNKIPDDYSNLHVTDAYEGFDTVHAVHGKYFKNRHPCSKCSDIYDKQWKEVEQEVARLGDIF